MLRNEDGCPRGSGKGPGNSEGGQDAKLPEIPTTSRSSFDLEDIVTNDKSRLRRPATIDPSSVSRMADLKEPVGMGLSNNGQACPALMFRDLWRVDDYVLSKKLYEGATSKVFRATCKRSGMTVALKAYIKSELHPINHHQVRREIEIHSSLIHDNIIEFYGWFEDNCHYYIVQEFASGGDLFDEMRRRTELMKESEAVSLVILPVLNALAYMHSKGVIHRDLKPENILFTQDMQLKIGDFGLSVNQKTERPVTRAGTLEYMPPEVLKNPGKRAIDDNKDRLEMVYDERVDIWSLGVVAYELLFGFPAFGKNSKDSTIKRIFTARPYYYPEIRTLSTGAEDFLGICLRKSPSNRLYASDLRQHDWLHTLDRQKLSKRNSVDIGQAMQQRDQANQGAEGGGVQLHRRRSMHVKLKELCGEHLDECTTEQCDDSLPVPSLKPSGVETLKQRRKTIDAKKFKELAAEGVGTETVLGIGTASGSFDAAFATACSLTSKALGASPLPEARSSGRGSADTVGDRSRMLSYRRSTFSDKIQPQPPRLADTTAISKKPFEERCNLGITGPASQPNDAKGSSTNRTENQDTPKLLTRPRQTVGGTLTSSLRKSLEAHRKSLNSFTAGELQREIQGVRFSLAEKR